MLNNINSNNTFAQNGLANQATSTQNMSAAQPDGSNQLGQHLTDRFGAQGAQLLALLNQIMALLTNGVTQQQPNTINGTNRNDTLEGGPGRDIINGHAGHDQLNGRGGDDIINGGAGADTISGGHGNDELRGDAGNDILLGDQGNDIIFGGDGNDLAFGGTGDDRLQGGDGTDFLLGGAGNDTLRGDRGDDFLHGGAGADVFDLSTTATDIAPIGQPTPPLFNNGVDFIADFQSGVDKIDVGVRLPPSSEIGQSQVTYFPDSGQLWVDTSEGRLASSRMIAQFPPGTQISQADILNGDLVIRRGSMYY